MVAKNDVTGDPITSKAATDAFREGWERIFNAKEDEVRIEQDYNGGVLISICGNRNLTKLTKRQFDLMVIEILKQVTAEQVYEAMKEGE